MEAIPLSAATWWYVAALSAGGFGACAALAVAVLLNWSGGVLAWLRSPGFLVAAVCGVGFVIAGLAAWDRWDHTFISIDGNALRVQVEFGAKLGSAVLAGTGLAAAAALAGALMGRGARTPRLLACVLPAVAIAGIIGATLAMAKLSAHEPDLGADPLGTLVTDPQAEASELVSGLVLPTGLAVAPDGTIFYKQLVSPELSALTPDGETAVVANLPVKPGERVFDIELHPDWPAEPYAYLTIELAEGEERWVQVVRLALGKESSGEATVMVDHLPIGGDHPASALAICGEYLFVSTGDTDRAEPPKDDSPRWQVQDPRSAAGKVLRYRLDGIEVTPAGVITDEPPVYAMGFRNLFGLACDPATGYPLGGENGFEGRDQVRLIPPGSNHEWPFSDTRDRLTPPLYDSGLRAIAPTGIAARASGDGVRILFTAYHSNALYELVVDGDGNAEPLRRLFKAPSGALALALDPNGCAIVADGETIWRVAIDGCVAP